MLPLQSHQKRSQGCAGSLDSTDIPLRNIPVGASDDLKQDIINQSDYSTSKMNVEGLSVPLPNRFPFISDTIPFLLRNPPLPDFKGASEPRVWVSIPTPITQSQGYSCGYLFPHQLLNFKFLLLQAM